MEQEKNNKQEESQKEAKKEVLEPKSSKKQTLITLISVVVIIILIGLIIIYGKKKPAGDGQESATSKFFKEFAKEVKQESPAQLASLKLFEFNNKEDLNFWSEKVQATPYALKPELAIEKNTNGSTVLALGIEPKLVKISSANWEITKNFEDLSKYVGTEKGVPLGGKIKFKILTSKNNIGSIEYFIGNDPNRWVKYTPDLKPLKDGDWSDVEIDLKNPLQKGEEIDWKSIDWGRLVIFPSNNPVETTVYLEDIEITNEK